MNERERVEAVMKAVKMSARQFAKEIGVQPGTISNMKKGRNNPSYDVMKKIMKRFPTLNPEWLLLESGSMWRTEPGKEAGLFDTLAPDFSDPTIVLPKEEPQTPAAPPKQIIKIVVYYSDNTYEEFTTNPLTH